MNDTLNSDKIRKDTVLLPEEKAIIEKAAQKTFRSTSSFIRMAAVKEAKRLCESGSDDL